MKLHPPKTYWAIGNVSISTKMERVVPCTRQEIRTKNISEINRIIRDKYKKGN